MSGHLVALVIATAASLVVGTPTPLIAIGISIGTALCFDHITARERSTTR
jgi:hypothetical protein